MRIDITQSVGPYFVKSLANTLGTQSANKVFDKILGIDISVLSWTKTRSKKRNTETRHKA